jgi:hypothetical protein
MVKSLLMKIQSLEQVKTAAYSIITRQDAARCLTFVLKHKKVDFGSIPEIAELASTRPKLAYYLFEQRFGKDSDTSCLAQGHFKQALLVQGTDDEWAAIRVRFALSHGHGSDRTIRPALQHHYRPA